MYDVGVEYAVLCAAYATENKYKWRAGHAAYCTALTLNPQILYRKEQFVECARSRSSRQCALMAQPCAIVVCILFYFRLFSNGVQCGFIGCGVLVANLSMQWCESV